MKLGIVLLLNRAKSTTFSLSGKMRQFFYIAFLISLLFCISCSKEEIPDLKNNPNNLGFEGINIIQHEFQGIKLVIAGGIRDNFITSFENIPFSGEYFEFTAIQDSLPVIMKDNYGGRWNIFGQAISGPAEGEVLKPTTSYMGFWFGFGAFYPGADIYSQGTINVEINNPISEGWLINKNQVFAGAAAADAIPSIDNPDHINFRLRDFLNGFFVEDDDLVLGIYIDDIAIAYPHNILNWHEIVNDKIGNTAITLSYCPLTGTGISWNRNINGEETTYGVSGLLYNSNLIPYDRKTESFWSQMRLDCIHGDLMNFKTENYTVIETTWKTWKTIFPETKVLSQNTGFDWDYNEYPYGDYATNHNLIGYPLIYDDTRIPRKERVHGIIIKDKVMVFRFSDFN